jgi:hypothetical protein
MSKQSRVLWIIIIQVIIVACIGIYPNIKAVGWQSQEGNSLDEERIMNATVQIYIISLTDEIAEAGLPYTNLSVTQVREYLSQGWGYDMGRGLGTLIHTQGGDLIVTHDHWGDILRVSDLIELRDAQNNLLLELTNLEFRKLLRFEDAGTMALDAPPSLGLAPVSLGDSRKVTPGQVVLLTRRQPGDTGEVEVIQAAIKGEEQYEARPAWKLETLNDTPISPGDSGGGVWLNGQLVGNLWARHKVIDWRIWTWDSLEPEEKATRDAYAAPYPMQIQSALTNSRTNVNEGATHLPRGEQLEKVEP